MELNLPGCQRQKEKRLYKYIGNKRKIRKTLGHSSPGLVTTWHNTQKKAEELNTSFMLVFTIQTDFQESQALEAWGLIWSKEDLSLVQQDQVRKYLRRLDLPKPMGLDGCTHKNSGSWLMLLWGRSEQYFNNHGSWEGCLKTQEKQRSLLSSRMAREIQGNTS